MNSISPRSHICIVSFMNQHLPIKENDLILVSCHSLMAPNRASDMSHEKVLQFFLCGDTVFLYGAQSTIT